VRVIEPPPHDLVQLDQSLSLIAQSVMVQSSGHSCVLHSSVSAACGHASPPKLAPACARVRDWEPPPHDCVQLDQPSPLSAQFPMPQSRGQSWTLQARVSSRYGHT
jgi:hypothetical protein